MNVPLGHAIGNALEVKEAIDVLQGKEIFGNLVELSYDLSADMISMGLGISKKEAFKKVLEVINNGSAYNKFLELVKCQGGNIDKIQVSSKKKYIKAKSSGKIKHIDALKLGKLSVMMGAGRQSKGDRIDYSVGIRINKLVGEEIKKGEVLATLYVNDKFDKKYIDEDIFDIV